MQYSYASFCKKKITNTWIGNALIQGEFQPKKSKDLNLIRLFG